MWIGLRLPQIQVIVVAQAYFLPKTNCMSYVVVKQMKSRGIAFLLVFLFGGFGLFYSSIVGGIIMVIVAPILMFLAFFIPGAQTIIFTLIIIFCCLYYIICFIWAIRAVETYNNKILANANIYEKHNSTQTNNQPSVLNNTNIGNTEKVNDEIPLEHTYKNGLSINEYYANNKPLIYSETIEPNNNTANTETSLEQNDKSKKVIWAALVALFLILGLIFSLYDSKTNSIKFNKISSLFSTNSKDKEEIKEQLQGAYFNIQNGAFTTNNLPSAVGGIPFYNTNGNVLLAMAFLPLAKFSVGINVEPKNINIYDFIDSNNTAKIKYELVKTEKNNTTTIPIEMTIKKIGGYWKFDASKFFGLWGKTEKLIKEKPKSNIVKTDTIKEESNIGNKPEVARYYKILSETYEDESTKEFTKKEICFTKRNIYILSNGKEINKWKIIKTDFEDEDLVYYLDNGDKLYQLGENISLWAKKTNKTIKYYTEEENE